MLAPPPRTGPDSALTRLSAACTSSPSKVSPLRGSGWGAASWDPVSHCTSSAILPLAAAGLIYKIFPPKSRGARWEFEEPATCFPKEGAPADSHQGTGLGMLRQGLVTATSQPVRATPGNHQRRRCFCVLCTWSVKKPTQTDSASAGPEVGDEHGSGPCPQERADHGNPGGAQPPRPPASTLPSGLRCPESQGCAGEEGCTWLLGTGSAALPRGPLRSPLPLLPPPHPTSRMRPPAALGR